MTVDVQIPEIHVIGKLREIPIVDCACNRSTDVYKKIKESNGLISWTFQSAEGAFMTALGAVAPVAYKLQQPIHVVDDTLCKGLDVLQEKVPIIKESPSQIVEMAKTKVSQMSSSTAEHVHSITNKSWDTANHVLSTHYGNVALSGLDSVSSTADRYIDYYLPATEGEENIHPHPNSQCEDKVLHTVHTVSTLSTKVGRRVYNRVARPSPQELQPMSEIKPKEQ